MSKSKMLSFRLDSALLRKIDLLQISRHKTRGQIIREAVQLYFSVHHPASQQKNTDDSQFDSPL
jgi:predicted transcriptional regulator